MNTRTLLTYGAVLMTILVVTVFVSGCVETRNLTKDELSSAHECKNISTYGNGVLYFDCNEEYFAYALSDYIEKHDVVVTSIAAVPAWTTATYYKGYFVIVTNKSRIIV